MVQNAGRVTCPRCGANNFDTVATCFKCAAPLGQSPRGGASQATPRPASPLPAEYPLSVNGGSNAINSPLNPIESMRPMGVMNAPLPAAGYGTGGYVGAGMGAPTGDSRVARRAAVLLALTFPFFGLPIGWAFMMIEDQRRQAIGRLCVNWSLIALVFHLLLTFVFMQSMSGYLQLALKLTQAAAQSRGQSGGMPGMP